MLQLYFSDPGRSTAYLGVGWIHAEAALHNVSASVDGVAANLGYEWKWQSGFGILLGGGVAKLGDATATDGSSTVSIAGGVHFNLEFGLRYMMHVTAPPGHGPSRHIACPALLFRFDTLRLVDEDSTARVPAPRGMCIYTMPIGGCSILGPDCNKVYNEDKFRFPAANLS